MMVTSKERNFAILADAYREKYEKAEAEATRLSEAETRLRGLLKRCNEFLKHAPEFPLGLLAEAEELQSELAKELRDE